MLLPAPVELPCRPKHADGALCDRDAALADVKERFGAEGTHRRPAPLPVRRRAEGRAGAELHCARSASR